VGFAVDDIIMRRHGAAPWRFSSVDYRAAEGGRPLHGEPVAALWDPDLQATMLETGRAVHEEQVLDLLLIDLAGGRGR
jgi:hypothetical protein